MLFAIRNFGTIVIIKMSGVIVVITLPLAVLRWVVVRTLLKL